MKERERERKRRGKTLLKEHSPHNRKEKKKDKINEREREDRRVLFIRDKKRYKDIYILTHIKRFGGLFFFSSSSSFVFLTLLPVYIHSPLLPLLFKGGTQDKIRFRVFD